MLTLSEAPSIVEVYYEVAAKQSYNYL